MARAPFGVRAFFMLSQAKRSFREASEAFAFSAECPPFETQKARICSAGGAFRRLRPSEFYSVGSSLLNYISILLSAKPTE